MGRFDKSVESREKGTYNTCANHIYFLEHSIFHARQSLGCFKANMSKMWLLKGQVALQKNLKSQNI